MRITLIGTSDFCGRPWGPPRVNDGIPGTEEAFIHMADRLGRRGHAVTVYAHTGPFAGRYDSVEWRDIATLPETFDSDIVVTTNMERIPYFGTSALIYYWSQIFFETIHRKTYERVHKFMLLSEYCAEVFAGIGRDKIYITRNGIDPAAFDRAVARQPFKIVYGSDYDRGLLILLSAWPQIRQAHPEAELSIFYGWDIFDRKVEMAIRMDPSTGPAWANLKTQIEAGMRQPGITHLGRIGHDRVAEEFLSAAVWAYPCTFSETSCITAMKAQAAGAIPVVIATAALRDTVRWGLRAPGFPREQPVGEKERIESERIVRNWVRGLIGLLGNQQAQEEMRPAMMADSRDYFSWDRIAAEWEAEFAAACAGR